MKHSRRGTAILALFFSGMIATETATAWVQSFHKTKRSQTGRQMSLERNRMPDANKQWEQILQTCQHGLIQLGLVSTFVFLQPGPSQALSDAKSLSHIPSQTLYHPQQSLSHISDTSTQSFLSDSTSQLLAEAPSDSAEQGAILEEVWALIDKYFVDRTFNGQDWTQTRSSYEERLSTTTDEMSLVKEMVKSLGDKYSRLLDVQQYTAIQKYDLIGVGVTLMPNQEKEIIVGAPPIAESAAAKAGLKVGDKVLAVNGMQTKGRTAFDIIDQISEKPNAATVTMTIQSIDNSEVRDVTMDRRFQEVKNPVRYKISETRKDGTTVGYIRISEFNSLVKANLQEALKNLETQGANAFVLDIRMNGGGAFQSAVEISGLFFEDRVATYVVDGTNAVLPFKTTKGQQLVPSETPVVIWVDGGSASASEVFAGSLHDNCKAVIMGEKSFGKGLIQAVYGLKNGAGLVLTVAKYVTPNQNEIQGIGITPDVPGKNIVPPLLPGIGTDTSKIDFSNIKSRLSSTMCSIPKQ